ncbi:MAG: DUF3237 domain-containing protein [Acidobacteriota bacterium]
MTTDPQLEFAFEARVQIAAPIDFGVTRQGHRRVIPILSGVVEGPRLQGKVLEGGADWQILHTDGGADLEARYTIQANDGALIYVNNRGMRRGSPDVLKRLNAGETIDVSQIYFRSVATFETSAPAYAWLADALFVGTGERYPDRVVLRFYRVA